MQTIDEARLETDLDYRFHYLAEFVGFGAADQAALQAAAPLLGPAIPELVARTYEKLLAYDATARHFVPRQSGAAAGPAAGTTALSLDHPHVQFRREHLARWFQQILGRSCDGRMVLYLDMVGKIHTPAAGNAEIDVPLVQMNALMGLLADVVADCVGAAGLDAATTLATLRAFQKFFWIQADFITRHYAARKPAPTG